MIFWDIIVYFSAIVCYLGAIAVIYGWVKFGLDKKKRKS